MNYKAILSYKGTNFHGLAIQKNVLTIQGLIQDALFELFNLHIQINASGRTDAYVHANEQVINIKHKNLNISPNDLKRALNSKLGNDVWVQQVKAVDDDFHARFDAKRKRYCYKINISKKYNVHEHDIVYQYNKDINLKKIKEIIPLFVKKQDFLSFSTSKVQDTIREVYSIKITKKDNYLFIKVEGSGFLRSMVRMIVGTFLAYNEDKIGIDTIQECFKNPKKGKAIYKAPGCGLYLDKVFYK